MPTTHSDAKILAASDNSLFTYEEAEVASGSTIYPGMAVEKTGENSDHEETPTVQPVSSADKVGENFIIALTPRAPPRGADSDIPIEHEYDAGESVQIAVCQPGCEVQNALLADGTGLATSAEANVSYDDRLGSSSDGSLKNTSTAGATLCRAREAVDNSGGGGDQGGISAERLNVEVV
jgi:hypothetical protein